MATVEELRSTETTILFAYGPISEKHTQSLIESVRRYNDINWECPFRKSDLDQLVSTMMAP